MTEHVKSEAEESGAKFLASIRLPGEGLHVLGVVSGEAAANILLLGYAMRSVKPEVDRRMSEIYRSGLAVDSPEAKKVREEVASFATEKTMKVAEDLSPTLILERV